VLAGNCPVLNENCRPVRAEPSSFLKAKTEYTSSWLYRAFRKIQEDAHIVQDILFS
jgi:hypothetical protein